MLIENRDVLDAIANMLVEKEKINGAQMLELIQRIKPQLNKKELAPAWNIISIPLKKYWKVYSLVNSIIT